jgi:RHS repeat-associated protein
MRAIRNIFRSILTSILLVGASDPSLADVNYLIDSNRDYPVVVSETDQNGVTLSTYTYGADPVPISRRDQITGEIHYYHYDGNFNLTAISDQTGNIIASYVYDSFGNIIQRNGIGLANEEAMFAGHKLDTETQQYYMRSRYYDPNIGRLTQQDSFQGNQGVPQSLHKYTYAHNDPVNNRDPSGKFITGLTTGQNIAAVLALTATATYTSLQTSHSNGYPGQYPDSGSLANEAILLMSSVRSGLNEIIYFNTKHTKNVINGLLQDAEEHADKIGGSPPEDPNRNHWKKEVRAFLQKARRLADKRLKGNTRTATLQKIDEIASRAGMKL